MAIYRKRPIEIEAIKLNRTMTSLTKVYKFMKWYTHTGSKMGQENFDKHLEEQLEKEGIIIPTLEGEHLASWGDYIIKGVKGEFYPCKPDIFKMTYEIIEE